MCSTHLTVTFPISNPYYVGTNWTNRLGKVQEPCLLGHGCNLWQKWGFCSTTADKSHRTSSCSCIECGSSVPGQTQRCKSLSGRQIFKYQTPTKECYSCNTDERTTTEFIMLPYVKLRAIIYSDMSGLKAYCNLLVYFFFSRFAVFQKSLLFKW